MSQESKPERKSTAVTSMMKLVKKPESGKFYSVGWKSSSMLFDDVPWALWSEKSYYNADNHEWFKSELAQIWSGQIVLYVGKLYQPRHGNMHKIGFLDCFGVVYADCVEFYEVDLSEA